MVKYQVRYVSSVMNDSMEWMITEESDAESFSTNTLHPIGIINDLVNSNFLSPLRKYTFIDNRYRSVVLDSITKEPILILEEAQ